MAKIRTFRFTRVTFGLVCSPFLLGATLKEHLSRIDSELAKEMESNLYVDCSHVGFSVDERQQCLDVRSLHHASVEAAGSRGSTVPDGLERPKHYFVHIRAELLHAPTICSSLLGGTGKGGL